MKIKNDRYVIWSVSVKVLTPQLQPLQTLIESYYLYVVLLIKLLLNNFIESVTI